MPNIPGIGMDSYLQLAKEATYGTAPAAATAKMELLSASINPIISVLEDPSMNNSIISRRAVLQGGQYVQGTFRVRANFVGMEELYRALLASYVFTGGSKLHTFKEGTALFSYSFDFCVGNIPTGKVNRIVGALVTGLRMAGTAGTGETGFITIDVDVVGVSIAPNTTPMTAASFPSAQPIIFTLEQHAQLQEGSGATTANMNVRSFEISAAIPYNTQRFILGSVNALRPVRNGFLDVTWTFEEEWTDYLLMDAVRGAAAVTAPLKVQFKQAANFDGTLFRTLTLQSSSVVGSEFTVPVDGPDVIYQTASYRCAHNTTDVSALVITTVNEAAALAA